MKIKTWIKYEESYLPPRCRKMRYRECEDFINVTLKEVEPTELQLAFEDNSYSGKGKIYFYRGKLWYKQEMWYGAAEHGCNTALEWLVWCHEHCSTFFKFKFDREYYGEDTSREAVIKAARNSVKSYILVDGELYARTSEPRYVINTFGLGHNHGGTGMFCEYHYNTNISKDNYFSATESEAAVEYANNIAQRRGDTNDVGKFKPFIVVHMPELVKVKPNKQHGNGNKFLNDAEEIIQNSDDAFTAGLLCMTLL